MVSYSCIPRAMHLSSLNILINTLSYMGRNSWLSTSFQYQSFISIPGWLHSIAAGGPAGGAEERLDVSYFGRHKGVSLQGGP